ncbi:hypothetical protein BX666DRAFT_2028071 [Dichotomocladium elegans]|nr:hypothetical protein BX666DRAFT_2028071 [Dichotomocladium elegans]
MPTPSTNEVLFVVIVVILFFIFLGLCVFCIYKATGQRKHSDEHQQPTELYVQHQQYITASQLESMRPPELALHLNSANQKRRSMLDKFVLTPQGVVRPSSTRQPSFLPMQHQAMAARDAQIAAMVAAQPPPAYGDYRASVRLDQSLRSANDEKHE